MILKLIYSDAFHLEQQTQRHERRQHRPCLCHSKCSHCWRSTLTQFCLSPHSVMPKRLLQTLLDIKSNKDELLLTLKSLKKIQRNIFKNLPKLIRNLDTYPLSKYFFLELLIFFASNTPSKLVITENCTVIFHKKRLLNLNLKAIFVSLLLHPNHYCLGEPIFLSILKRNIRRAYQQLPEEIIPVLQAKLFTYSLDSLNLSVLDQKIFRNILYHGSTQRCSNYVSD